MSSKAIASLVVPGRGQSVWLVTLSAAAMAFLAVFGLALAVTSARLADTWSDALAQTATVRIAAPPEEMDFQTELVLDVLRTTPGITGARVLEQSEQAGLLEAWLGPDLPLDALPVPRLVELTETRAGPDRQGLRLRLAAEAPGAVYDDHTRWRRPLVQAAGRLQSFVLFSLGLIAAVTGAMIALASSAALASNRQVITVLRLVGAKDRFIALAFVRRITRRALFGATGGTVLAMLALLALPEVGAAVPVLAGLGFAGWNWVLALAVPPVLALIALAASMATAIRMLRGVT